MSIAQQIIAEEIAKAMLASEIRSINGQRAFASLPDAARAFAVELGASIEERLTHMGVPLAELMEGEVFLSTTPADYSATGFVRGTNDHG